MAVYILAQAIAATGRSRSALRRAIHAGRLSATRDETGAFLTDESELARVYPEARRDAPADPPIGEERRAGLAERLAAVEAENAALQEAQQLRDEVISDLRQQRDREAEERRQAQAQVAALLTDQRPAAPTSEQPPTPRAWWPWGRRRRP